MDYQYKAPGYQLMCIFGSVGVFAILGSFILWVGSGFSFNLIAIIKIAVAYFLTKIPLWVYGKIEQWAIEKFFPFMLDGVAYTFEENPEECVKYWDVIHTSKFIHFGICFGSWFLISWWIW